VKIAVVTDSHLAPDASACSENWGAVRAFIASSGADLTVHLGDVTVDGLHDPAHFTHVEAISAGWPTPIRYLPGNHDIGDNSPGPGLAAKHPLDPVRIADFRAVLGPDYWCIDEEGWRVIGLDAQLFGSGGIGEAAQWTWLAEVAAESRGRPVILLLHKPLFQDLPGDEAPHQRYVPVAPRRRLLELLAPVRVHAVLSGHTHQYRDRVDDDVRHVWVPSTAFYLPDEIQERLGEKITGLGILELLRGEYRFHLVCPDGVVRHSALDHPIYPELVGAASAGS